MSAVVMLVLFMSGGVMVCVSGVVVDRVSETDSGVVSCVWQCRGGVFGCVREWCGGVILLCLCMSSVGVRVLVSAVV
jgi:hypothetical protein